MKKIAYRLLIILSIVSFQNCNYDSVIPELDYITFSKATYTTGVDPGGSTTLDVIAYTVILLLLTQLLLQRPVLTQYLLQSKFQQVLMKGS